LVLTYSNQLILSYPTKNSFIYFIIFANFAYHFVAFTMINHLINVFKLIFIFKLAHANLEAVDLTLVDLTYPMNNKTIDWSEIPFQLNYTQDLIKIDDNYQYW